MAVDFDKFLNWAESRFGDVVVKGSEIRLNSIFQEDYKHHMWCNCDPIIKDGTKRDHGVFHCFKSDNKGSLITLVMAVDKCDFNEALDTLGQGDLSLAILEKRLVEFFANKEDVVVQKTEDLQLPPASYKITDLPEDNFYRVTSEIYLYNRKLNAEGLYICISGDYRNRIIIPYYDRDGKLIYWNARVWSDEVKGAKYLGPDKVCGIGKEDVIYVPEWPSKELTNIKLYMTEGEFDARSLFMAEFYSAAFGGKEFSENQASLIRGCLPVLCLDNDFAGEGAIRKIGDSFLKRGFPELNFVRPPNGFKDWNMMLEKVGPQVMKMYIEKNEKQYTSESSLFEWMRHFKPRPPRYN